MHKKPTADHPWRQPFPDTDPSSEDMGLKFAKAAIKDGPYTEEARKDLTAFVADHSSGLTGPCKTYG